MSGTLHIFRRSVVNGDPHYQVNYTKAGNTYARVIDTDGGLTDFLIDSGALGEEELNAFWDTLAADGHASISNVEIPDSSTPMMGLRQAPSEY